MNIKLATVSFALATSLVGCDPGTQPGGMERTRAGDTIAVFSPSPLHPDTIRARELMRWGRFSGDPELLFGEIRGFTPTSDGGLLVHDEGEGIRRYDARGRFVDRVARTGAGPGEVRSLLALAQAPDGSIAAYDLGNRRISVYGSEGVRTLPRPDGMPRYGGDALSFSEDGSLWVAVNPPFPEEGGIRHPRPIFARVDEEGALRDTLFTPGRLGVSCPVLSAAAYRRGFWEDVREPFVPKVKWGMTPEGSLLTGCPAKYEAEVVSRDGPVHRFRRPWRPLGIDDEHRHLLTTEVGIPGLPAERPAYVRLEAFSAGRLWIRPTLPSEPVPLPPEVVEALGVTHTFFESARAVFDVFTVQDGWLGTVALPPEARYSGFPTDPPVVIRGDSVWAVATDSLDVQYVVKYLVEWPPGLSVNDSARHSLPDRTTFEPTEERPR